MALNFEVNSNLKDIIAEFEDKFSSKQIRSMLASSMNASATQAKRLLIESAKKKYNLKPKYFNDGYRIQRANPANDTLSARLFVSGKPLPMLAFIKGSQRKGVTVYIEKQTTLKEAFKESVGNGHEGVFRRFGNKVAPTKGKWAGKTASRGPNKGELIKRQRINEYYAMTAAQYVFFSSDTVMPDVDAMVAKDFAKRLDEKWQKQQAK